MEGRLQIPVCCSTDCKEHFKAGCQLEARRLEGKVLKKSRIFKRKYFLAWSLNSSITQTEFCRARFRTSHFCSRSLFFFFLMAMYICSSFTEAKQRLHKVCVTLSSTALPEKAIRWAWTLRPPIKMLLLSINTELLVFFLITIIDACGCFKWVGTGFVSHFVAGIYLSHWAASEASEMGSEQCPDLVEDGRCGGSGATWAGALCWAGPGPSAHTKKTVCSGGSGRE